MSSVFERILPGLLASSVACAACSQETGQGVALSQPPPIPHAVGPIPGPQPRDAGATTNPFSDDPMSLQEGRQYFTRYNCNGCHGDHGGGGMGPSLRDLNWLYGGSDAAIFASIAEGRGRGMPAWGTKVPEQIIWKLVAYIRSLRTAFEPSPPDQTIPKPPRDLFK